MTLQFHQIGGYGFDVFHESDIFTPDRCHFRLQLHLDQCSGAQFVKVTIVFLGYMLNLKKNINPLHAI